MPPRPFVRPAALGAAVALVTVSAVCAAASPPPVPPVAEIPVAPLPAPKRTPAPARSTATTTTTTVTTTTTTPSLAAIAVEPAAPAPGATEAMPALPAPAAPAAAAAAPHVVLVDELPFRATHTRARELSEHEHEHEHAHHGKKRGRHGRPFHPAPGIVVDVPDAQGGASAADEQRVARSTGYWPFRHCYEEGLRRDQHMSGKVAMDLSIAPGGAVDHAGITSSTIRDESVALCVAREAAHLALTPAESATSAKLEVTLSTGDEPVPVPHAAPHAEELREALRASWPAVRQCYASEVARHPDAGGRMELRFRVHGNGEIAEVSEGDTRFGDVAVTRCVLGVYRAAKLPAIGHGSHETTFVYGLHFETRDQNVSPAAK